MVNYIVMINMNIYKQQKKCKIQLIRNSSCIIYDKGLVPNLPIRKSKRLLNRIIFVRKFFLI